MTNAMKPREDNPQKYLAEAMTKARKKFGKKPFNMIYDHIAGKWNAVPFVKKGDGGLSAYERRRFGMTEDESFESNGLKLRRKWLSSPRSKRYG
ncbi:hypothetical protein IG9_00424 [Bacillus cereus HuA2-9]|nr:hypothetical protein IG9_00424 [Bacillus cereus HuA2-9]